MIVGQIVDRCHILASNRSVIKRFISQYKHGHQTWKTFSRPIRKQVMRDIINRHQENCQLYRELIKGSH